MLRPFLTRKRMFLVSVSAITYCVAEAQSLALQKNAMLKKVQNDWAERRYRETFDQYSSAMEQNPALTLKVYCQMRYVIIRGYWNGCEKRE